MHLAVDIGGTKTLLAVFDARGQIKESHKFETPEDYSEFISLLEAELNNLKTQDFIAAGIAVPARLDRENGIAIAFGNRPWTNEPIEDDIRKITNCPVVLENDSKLAALSEAKLIIKDFKKVLYITISTGIGGGLVIDGKLEPNLVDNEVGQMLLEHNGELMDWEDFASGRAFSKKFGKKVSDIDPGDTEAWYYIARNIAIGMVDLIATLTPEAIIIGGGVGAHLELFQDRLNEQLKLYENPMFKTPPILKAQRPEEAVIYGCYELVKDKYGNAPTTA